MAKHHPARLACTVLMLAACLHGLTACGAAPRRYEFTAPKMGTTVGIVLYALDEPSAKSAAELAFARIDELNAVLSDYEPESEINRLSRSAGSGQWVAIGDDLMAVLNRAQEIAQLTGGAFDVTAGQPIRLWRRARRQAEPPDPDRLAQAMTTVGWNHLHLDVRGRRAKLDLPGTHLDVGGIAKGYTAAQVLKVLRVAGYPQALVAMAGDIGAGDPPPGAKGWTIELDPMLSPAAGATGPTAGDPNAATRNTPRRHLIASNVFVSTAGDAYQHVVLNGVRYSHIIDPKTGVGLTQPIACTVVSTDGATADGLDTAFCVMGVDRALPLADKLPGVAAIFYRLRPDGSLEIIESARAKKLNITR